MPNLIRHPTVILGGTPRGKIGIGCQTWRIGTGHGFIQGLDGERHAVIVVHPTGIAAFFRGGELELGETEVWWPSERQRPDWGTG